MSYNLYQQNDLSAKYPIGCANSINDLIKRIRIDHDLKDENKVTPYNAVISFKLIEADVIIFEEAFPQYVIRIHPDCPRNYCIIRLK